jgi:penicillin-binding protein 1B
MEVTIGRVMNLAAKAGLPPVKKAYPAMALGASEATPLQIASAYTAFAASGTRSTPIAINRVTTGEGTTIAAPTSQKNDVLRPDVAYVMTSFLKDVVNRGTAARLGARGFKNVAGRIGIAGKTGTSRDGWFAGFTPNLVCVVWVGFDDGSQLGLTGADSALPIWADFMSAALSDHPEWNGDWAMPEGIEQAEIDTHTGQLAAADSLNKRTELFISGTAPRAESEEEPVDDGTTTDEAAPEGDPNNMDFPPLPEETPAASPRVGKQPKPDGRAAPADDGATRLGTITLEIDPTTGLIADPTVCPVIRTKTFTIGQEPRQFCGPQYHGGGASSTPGATRPRRATP